MRSFRSRLNRSPSRWAAIAPIESASSVQSYRRQPGQPEETAAIYTMCMTSWNKLYGRSGAGRRLRCLSAKGCWFHAFSPDRRAHQVRVGAMKRGSVSSRVSDRSGGSLRRPPEPGRALLCFPPREAHRLLPVAVALAAIVTGPTTCAGCTEEACPSSGRAGTWFPARCGQPDATVLLPRQQRQRPVGAPEAGMKPWCSTTRL